MRALYWLLKQAALLCIAATHQSGERHQKLGHSCQHKVSVQISCFSVVPK
jgi:hypothetical protein